MSETREWLETLFGRSPGWFTVIPFTNGSPDTPKPYSTADLANAARYIEKTGKTKDVYVSVGTYKRKPPRGKRGSTEDVQSLAGWWADLDIGTEGHKTSGDGKPNPANEAEALSIIEEFPEPSAVFHSGGGLQAWWLFDEPWVFEDSKPAAKASDEWQARLKKAADAKGFHVDTLGDLPRIMRVPGTFNHKTENVRPVVVKSLGLQRYPTSELTVIGETDDETPPPPRGFTTWEAILEPHGWTKAGVRSGDNAQLWCRPGKTPSEGHSAVTDPYGVPVMVNFSASAGLPTGPGQRLTKFKVWAYLNYGGDMKEAKAGLETAAAVDPTLLAERAARFQPLDWPTVFAAGEEPVEWLIEPLVERGAGVAFYSEAKAGKSLLWLELAACLSSKRTPFVVPRGEAEKRYKVLYIDMENTIRDIGERLGKMGFAPDDLTGWFWYYSFPAIGNLDTKQGALDVLSLAVTHEADLVIIDTLSRVCEGEENDNNTYHEFYQHTGIALKSRGIALVRLDHSGKDKVKGMRGASSKTTDIDVVWELTAKKGDPIVRMRRTFQRNPHGSDELNLRRLDEPILHHTTDMCDLPKSPEEVMATPTVADKWREALKQLQGLEIPPGMSRRKFEPIYREEYGETPQLVRDVQAARKNKPEGPDMNEDGTFREGFTPSIR